MTKRKQKVIRVPETRNFDPEEVIEELRKAWWEYFKGPLSEQVVTDGDVVRLALECHLDHLRKTGSPVWPEVENR